MIVQSLTKSNYARNYSDLKFFVISVWFNRVVKYVKLDIFVFINTL